MIYIVLREPHHDFEEISEAKVYARLSIIIQLGIAFF